MTLSMATFADQLDIRTKSSNFRIINKKVSVSSAFKIPIYPLKDN